MSRDIRALIGHGLRAASVLSIRAGGTVAVFLLQVLMARTMGATETGLAATAMSAVLVAGLAATAGYQAGSTRFIVQNETLGRRDLALGFIRRGWTVVAVAGPLIAAAGLGLAWLHGDLGSGLGVWGFAALTVPFMALLLLDSGYAHGCSRFTLSFLPSAFLRQTLVLAVVAGGVAAGMAWTAVGVVQVFFAVVALTALGQWAVLRRHVGRRLAGVNPVYDTRHWVGTGAELSILLLFSGLYGDLVVVLAALVLPPADVAYLNAAIRFAGVLGFVVYAVNATLEPRLSAMVAHRDHKGMQALLRMGVHLRVWPVLAAALLTVPFGGALLGLFGPDFRAGHGALVVLALSHGLIAATGPVFMLISITRRQRSAFGLLAGLLAATVVLVPAAALWGVTAVAWVVLAVTAVWCVVLRRRLLAALGVDPSLLAAWRPDDARLADPRRDEAAPSHPLLAGASHDR